MTSGEYLGCFFIAPFSQTMEPLQNPGRFNPMFVHAEGGDFRLKTGSPMIDKATATSLFKTDKEGLARPKGSRIDIGAHEQSRRVDKN
ncbi:choice-of-anchor Q domain-containing protein [Massilia sp. Mn16-1_5]|uniref:choice-of-anchor Q domain-containing protein n=1 Tax=Massilia sp. Mn16-1_5 TaxID=2079199 RepID=UPI0027D94EE1|nr:choice-of-anchor Q domain-containing protein [Massilia sp. Mn16-1_5]